MANYSSLNNLSNRGVVFINELNTEIEGYLLSLNGTVIKNLQSPDNIKVNDVRNIIGEVPTYELGKVGNHIHKMVSPSRLNLREVAVRLCYCLDYLKEIGKNETTINNLYFRFLCWLHYEFLEILKGNITGNIIYTGVLNPYIIMALYIISGTGINITIISSDELDDNLATKLDIITLKEDNVYKVSSDFDMENLVLIPKSKYQLGINVWLKGDSLEEIRTPYNERNILIGQDVIKSAFINQIGVSNIDTYTQSLYSLYKDLNGTIIDFIDLSPNEMTELRMKHRSDNIKKYIISLCKDLNLELELYKLLVSQFTRFMFTEKDILFIFNNLRKYKDCKCLFYLQSQAISEVKLYTLYLLSCLGNDVVIVSPSGIKIGTKVPYLYELTFPYSLDITEFPTKSSDLVVTTVAHNAETELNTLLYDGSAGIYRNRQFKKANTVKLVPMYEEIDILWDKDLSVRQGFMSDGDAVSIPVIFAEVKGVKDGDTGKWCQHLGELLKRGSLLYNECNKFIISNDKHIHSAEIVRNKKIDVDLLLKHKNYPYSYLDKDIQFHMISKLQELLESETISGVYTNGIENEVIKVFLGISNNGKLLRIIQDFDFTKVNPKVVYVWMEKEKVKLKDIILLHYLHYIGFDVLIFTPTGYNVLDEFIDKDIIEKYYEGNGVEPFDVVFKKKSFINKMFRR